MGTMAGWVTRRKSKSEYEAALCEKAERYGEQLCRDGLQSHAFAIAEFVSMIERGEHRK